MKCPICGKPLRPSKKDPAYGLCDNCKKRFKLNQETESVKSDKKPAVKKKSTSIEKKAASPERKSAPSKKRTDPTTAKSVENQPKKNKKKKGGLLKFFLTFLLLVVIAGAAYFFFFGKDDLFNSSSESSSQETDADVTVDSTPTSVLQEETYNNIQISLVSTSESKGGDLASPSDGNIFYICEFQITNNSEENITINSLSDIEAFCGDYSVSEDIAGLLLPETEGKSSLDGTIAMGQTFKGVVTYQIPKDYDQMQFRLTPGFWNGDTATFTVSK